MEFEKKSGDPEIGRSVEKQISNLMGSEEKDIEGGGSAKKMIQSSGDDFEMKNEYDFSKGIRGRFFKPKKKQKTIRLDEDILIYFHRLAAIRKVGYQTLINEALRKVMNRDI